MSGNELRALAERSWELADRTSERLIETHERIALARRRRRLSAAVGSVACLLVALAITTALLTTGTDRPPEPAPAPRQPSTGDLHIAPADAAYRPANGTCWAVPAESAADETYGSDSSPQVPCDRPHTTETVEVLALPQPTASTTADLASNQCHELVRQYVGIDRNSWIPWGSAALLPSPEQIADGADWVRCDALFPADPSWELARVLNGSAALAADRARNDFWACLDQPLGVRDQPFVPCDRPHRSEQTGRIAVLTGLDAYPTARQRNEAAVQCEAGVPKRLSGGEAEVAWPLESTFEPGTDVTGVCFVHDPGGGLLPPRPDQEGPTP